MKYKILALCIVVLAIGVSFYLYVQPEKKQVTLLTNPIPSLLPHSHSADEVEADSINDPGHGMMVNSEMFTFEEDSWITDIEVITKGAPQNVLHHMILYKVGSENPQCPGRAYEEIFTVGADSRPDAHYSAPYGFFVPKGTKVFVSGMLHNPEAPRGEGLTYHDVQIGYRLTIEPNGKTRTKELRFYRLVLEDTPFCRSDDLQTLGMTDTFIVPAEQNAYRKRTSDDVKDPSRLIIPADGYIRIGAHLHPLDGGREVRVYRNGEVLFVSHPEKYGDKEWEWRTLPSPRAYNVSKGDVLTLETVYENPHVYPIRDAMAHLGVVFAPK